MNVICLMGRLTADPELRHTSNQIAVTSFTVAVDRRFVSQGQERQTDFINCVAWRQTAEFITRYFHKGNRIAVNGSLQARPFTDKEGNKRTSYEVVVDNAHFCESKNGGGNAVPGGESQVPAWNEPATAFSTASAGDFEEIAGDDDLPF